MIAVTSASRFNGYAMAFPTPQGYPLKNLHIQTWKHICLGFVLGTIELCSLLTNPWSGENLKKDRCTKLRPHLTCWLIKKPSIIIRSMERRKSNISTCHSTFRTAQSTVSDFTQLKITNFFFESPLSACPPRLSCTCAAPGHSASPLWRNVPHASSSPWLWADNPLYGCRVCLKKYSSFRFIWDEKPSFFHAQVFNIGHWSFYLE